HVPPKQLILVSDASVDKTETIAKSFGVRVFINSRNINKGLSINQVINRVFTPYVLVLDDDTRIGQTFIPTSLLDDGWSAVAFRIMPLPYPSLVNKLQQFEYGKTIFFGKASRKSIGAVSNISGAIGLYRTDLLKLQARRHSGQHGGEDQQRTLFTYLHSFGRGVTYIESSAYTLVPNTWRALWRQRSFKWSRSIQENFFLCWSIIASRHTPFLLKLEKSLQLFIFFTDPLRILLWWLILLNPLHLLTFYLFYLLLNTIAWRASRHATSFFLILLMPLYGLFKCLCRFIAHFYWFKVKYDYLIKNHYHRLVPDRNLFFEYGTVSVVVLFLWAVAIQRFFAVITG
ncbi:MAG: glycosyltransferase family 2 protein, partial [Candidatus Binatia bacterium]|nr:glycosyltransferase family 2 protein [Candidatus Binatia bacterium]